MTDAIRNITDNQTRAFAEACYDNNTVEEMQEVVNDPDPFDMEAWDVDEAQWKEAIAAALADRQADSQ